MSALVQIPGRVVQDPRATLEIQTQGRSLQFSTAGTWKTTEIVLVTGSVKTVLGLARASIKTFQGLLP